LAKKKQPAYIAAIAVLITLLLVAAAIYFLLHTTWLKWAIISLAILCAFVSLLFNGKKHSAYAEAELVRIDELEGYQFEGYVARLLRNCGYTQVTLTQESGDYGADITAYDRENKKIGFQCKRSHNTVGVQGVKDISAGMQYYHCEKGVVVTNSRFTQPARELAQKCQVELWDRNTLEQLIKANKVRVSK